MTKQQITVLIILAILAAGAGTMFAAQFYYLGNPGWRSPALFAGVAVAAFILFWLVPDERRKSTVIVMLAVLIFGQVFRDRESYWQALAVISAAVLVCLGGALWPHRNTPHQS